MSKNVCPVCGGKMSHHAKICRNCIWIAKTEEMQERVKNFQIANGSWDGEIMSKQRRELIADRLITALVRTGCLEL